MPSGAPGARLAPAAKHASSAGRAEAGPLRRLFPQFPRSFRLRLTLLYLGLFSLLFVLYSVFVYGGLSKSLEARIDETLSSEAETATGIFLDEFAETKGDVTASANEAVALMKLRSDEVAVWEGDRVLAGKTAPASG